MSCAGQARLKLAHYDALHTAAKSFFIEHDARKIVSEQKMSALLVLTC